MATTARFNELTRFREILSQAKNIVALTGAGTSAESGIPTFRGSGGFWRTYQSQDLASYDAFDKSPSLVWEFYHYRRELVLTKEPNKAHYALAKAESILNNAGKNLTIITQNIDGLHQRAGSKNVIELHGSLYKTCCLACKNVEINFDSPICPALEGLGAPDENAKSKKIPKEDLPRCKIETCKGLLRPHIVWFGENLDRNVLAASERALDACDACLIIGSSSVVYPAAMFAPALAARRVPVAEFNIEQTPATYHFKYHFSGPCSVTVPDALKDIIDTAAAVSDVKNVGKMYFSTSSRAFKEEEKIALEANVEENLTMKDKLKKFIKDYGRIVIVVHIGNSLIILSGLYSALYFGLDLTWILNELGAGDRIESLKKGGTFVIAYAISKLLAPLRFAITFTATPILVRHLRKIGILKKN